MRPVRRASGANGASAGRVRRRRRSRAAAGAAAPRRRTVPPGRSGCLRGAAEAKPDERPRHGRDRAERPDRPEREGRPPQRERRGGERPERRIAATGVRARAGATSRIAIVIAATRANGATRRSAAAAGRSEFAVRQAGGSEGAARGQQGALAHDDRPAHRQMAVARARGAHADIRRCRWSTQGQVRLNGERVTAASRAVKAGDVVTVALDRDRCAS